MHSMQKNAQPDDAWPHYDLDIAPTPAPWENFGAVDTGGWLLPSVGTYPCDDGK
jgi:hypothetical protein